METKTTETKTIMTKPVSWSNEQTRHVPFGLCDQRDRGIGALVSTWEETFELLPADHKGWYSMCEPGHYFVLRVQAARNRVEYGAIQHVRYFKTAEERERAAAEYLKKAELRARKLAGKGRS